MFSAKTLRDGADESLPKRFFVVDPLGVMVDELRFGGTGGVYSAATHSVQTASPAIVIKAGK